MDTRQITHLHATVINSGRAALLNTAHTVGCTVELASALTAATILADAAVNPAVSIMCQVGRQTILKHQPKVYLHTKMNFLGQGFQKSEQYRRTHRRVRKHYNTASTSSYDNNNKKVTAEYIKVKSEEINRRYTVHNINITTTDNWGACFRPAAGQPLPATTYII